MGEIVITYEKLFELLRLEKQREDLQRMDPDFYAHTLAYINQKKEVFDQSVDSSNIFVASDRERNRLLLENIKRILKELYDRREKKVIDIAINESRTGAKLINTQTMLITEKELYDSLVTQLTLKRKDVLWRLLNGMIPIGVNPNPTPRTENSAQEEPLDDQKTPFEQINDITISNHLEKAQNDPYFDENQPQHLKTGHNQEETGHNIQIIAAVDQIVGPDLQIYGPYAKDTITKLPVELAQALIKTGKAKPVEGYS